MFRQKLIKSYVLWLLLASFDSVIGQHNESNVWIYRRAGHWGDSPRWSLGQPPCINTTAILPSPTAPASPSGIASDQGYHVNISGIKDEDDDPAFAEASLLLLGRGAGLAVGRDSGIWLSPGMVSNRDGCSKTRSIGTSSASTTFLATTTSPAKMTTEVPLLPGAPCLGNTNCASGHCKTACCAASDAAAQVCIRCGHKGACVECRNEERLSPDGVCYNPQPDFVSTQPAEEAPTGTIPFEANGDDVPSTKGQMVAGEILDQGGNLLAFIAAGAAAGVLIVAIVIICLLRSRRRMLRSRSQQGLELRESMQREQHLERRVLQMKQGWIIPGKDVVLEKKLGAGGQGEVWRASWGPTKVAVKMLLASADEYNQKDFANEVEFLQTSKHVNIVLFHGAGQMEVDGRTRPFLVLELMELSLEALLHDPERCYSLDFPRKKRIAVDIASGMEYIHNLGHVHRDLKPANVLLSANDRAKLSDFGTVSLWKIFQHRVQHGFELSGSKVQENRKKTFMGQGTLDYQAPECFSTPPVSTQSSDVWSFSTVLWELASEKPPNMCEGRDPDSIRGPLSQVLLKLYKAGDRLSNLDASWPKAWCDIISQGWNFDSAARKPFSVIIQQLALVKWQSWAERQPGDAPVKGAMSEVSMSGNTLADTRVYDTIETDRQQAYPKASFAATPVGPTLRNLNYREGLVLHNPEYFDEYEFMTGGSISEPNREYLEIDSASV